MTTADNDNGVARSIPSVESQSAHCADASLGCATGVDHAGVDRADVNQPALGVSAAPIEVGVRTWSTHLRKTLRSVLVLTLSLWAAFPIYAAVGYGSWGTPGLASAAAAMAICWFGAAVAMLMMGVFQGANGAMPALMGGMVFRAGVPFLFGFQMQRLGGTLAAGEIFGMVVACYLFTLIVETTLSLRLINAPRKPHRRFRSTVSNSSVAKAS